MVAPHTAWEMSLEGKKPQLLKIFGIDYSVETQICRAATTSTLSVRLVDAATREIIWADQYPMSPAHVARHYRDLSGRILLRSSTRSSMRELSRYDAEQEPTAYHLYLIGQKQVRDARPAERPQGAPRLQARGPELRGFRSRDRRPRAHLSARVAADGARRPELLAEAAQARRQAPSRSTPTTRAAIASSASATSMPAASTRACRALPTPRQRNPQFADLLMDYSDALVHAGEPATASGEDQRRRSSSIRSARTPTGGPRAARTTSSTISRSDRVHVAHASTRAPSIGCWRRPGRCSANRGRPAEYVRKTKEIHPDFSVEEWLSVLPFRDPSGRRSTTSRPARGGL